VTEGPTAEMIKKYTPKLRPVFVDITEFEEKLVKLLSLSNSMEIFLKREEEWRLGKLIKLEQDYEQKLQDQNDIIVILRQENNDLEKRFDKLRKAMPK